MLSISKPLNAASAEKYYDRDNYYLESQGQWYGKLSDDLSLSGDIQKDDFSNLLRGFNVDGVTKLVESAGQKYEGTDEYKHRSGIDLTFSAPKSVSILSYSDSRIEAAFHRSLHQTLDHAEEEFAQTRKKYKKKLSYQNTGKALFSTFTHRSSRELDPQLHAHCILFNLTQSDKGEFKTIHNDKFYTNKMYLGQFFRNSLADEIRKIGYEVEITDRKHGFFEIQGVSKPVIEAFSKRSGQVKEEVDRLRELRFCNLSSDNLTKWARERTASCAHQADYESILSKEIEKLAASNERVYSKWDDAELAALATTNSRIPKKNVTKEVIIDQIEKTCASLGTSLSGLASSAQSQTHISNEFFPAAEIVMSAIKGTTENHSTFSRQDIFKKALKLSLGEYSYSQILEAFNDLLSSGEISFLGEGVSSSGKEKYYTSREIKFVERDVIRVCDDSLANSSIRIDREEANTFISSSDLYLKLETALHLSDRSDNKFTKYLSTVSDKAVANRLSELRETVLKSKSSVQSINIREELLKLPGLRSALDSTGSGFTQSQKRAINQIVSTENQISVIQGDAGTGKSFSCLYARELLEKNGFSVRGFTPTGKATDELAQAARIENASTLQKFILQFENMSEEDKASNFLKGKECFIIDEAGMIGSKVAHKLITIAKELEAKVVFIGDRKQFVSIEAGNIFAELQDKSRVDVTVMNDVIRQKTSQTRDIVSSISSKDYVAAFNYLSGYSLAESFNRKKAKNYSVGQMLCFGEDAVSVPAGTIAYITSIDKKNLTINFDADTYENNTRVTKNLSVTFNPAEHKEFQSFRVFNSHELSSNPYENVITEISDDEQRLRSVADDYLDCYAAGKNAIVITPTNDDRISLNNIIRESLVSDGKIEQGQPFTLRESFNLDGSASRFADSFSVGQVLVATRNIGEMNRGSEGRIQNVDMARNEISVEFVDRNSGEKREQRINVSENAGRFSVFSERSVNLGRGDRIAFLKNDELSVNGKKVKVRNGQLATIVSIDEKGTVQARIGDEKKKNPKMVSFNLNGEGRNGFNYLTTAYCLSEMKSQGITVDKIISHANSGKHISANSFYVSVTRCKNEIAVYTDDIGRLRDKVQKDQVKGSTLNFTYPRFVQRDDKIHSFEPSTEKSQDKPMFDSFFIDLDNNLKKANDKTVSL